MISQSKPACPIISAIVGCATDNQVTTIASPDFSRLLRLFFRKVPPTSFCPVCPPRGGLNQTTMQKTDCFPQTFVSVDQAIFVLDTEHRIISDSPQGTYDVIPSQFIVAVTHRSEYPGPVELVRQRLGIEDSVQSGDIRVYR